MAKTRFRETPVDATNSFQCGLCDLVGDATMQSTLDRNATIVQELTESDGSLLYYASARYESPVIACKDNVIENQTRTARGPCNKVPTDFHQPHFAIPQPVLLQ